MSTNNDDNVFWAKDDAWSPDPPFDTFLADCCGGDCPNCDTRRSLRVSDHDSKGFIGPLPYGAVVDNGNLYPEVYTDCTRYECDWLKLTVVEAGTIFHALYLLACEGDEVAPVLLDKLQVLNAELDGEGSRDFWEAQD